MPTSDQVTAQASGVALKFVGGEMYDAIMAGIEPELVSTNVKSLPEAYKDETDEQAAERAERYNRAFEAYEAALQAQQNSWEQQLAAMRKQAFQSTEKESHDAEQTDLSALEQTIAAQ